MHIYYCIAAKSVDEIVWLLIEKKLSVTSSTISGVRSAQMLNPDSAGGSSSGGGSGAARLLGAKPSPQGGSPDIRAFMRQPLGACTSGGAQPSTGGSCSHAAPAERFAEPWVAGPAMPTAGACLAESAHAAPADQCADSWVAGPAIPAAGPCLAESGASGSSRRLEALIAKRRRVDNAGVRLDIFDGEW